MPTQDLWYKDAIIYELHVKAFRDSSGDGIGDFAGLIEKLDYIQHLGVTAIWLLPFYPSPQRDDGYDISDYRGINPDYGTMRDFKSFVREAHRRSLKVITELVVNHTSDQHPWFQAARRAKPGTSTRDFYVWSDTEAKYADTRIIFTDTETSNWTWDPVAGAYYWHRFFHHQPDLNFDNPRVMRELKRVLRYWLDIGVDGLRLDAVPYLIERDGTNCENLPETHDVIKELRAEVDRRFGDRMLLAEANQWPEDVRPYFGDGDECHMAFHFPLMPRIFMALSQEDRRPITEIMARTPEIPGNCQWALFLRNHDELTLEMVTDAERDYMYREYAKEPRMRVNVGIRRRLAPLVENNPRRIEMLNSLLMSFPGTPVLYYGDELGMGDNVFLGDRNGVRTPMQWSPDRNAGFSSADPARLYLPTIQDPVYGFNAVNVEAQQRNPSSMLHFMRRIVALRRQHRAFGRGTQEFLRPRNRKILAYLRRWRGETILCVANLSRSVQPCELDLSEFAGRTPLELFGHTEFPPIGELPYFLTLGPWAYYWFRLEPAAEPIPLSKPAERRADVPWLTVEDAPEQIFGDDFRYTLAHDVVATHLPHQRWFRGKARGIAATTIVDRAKLAAGFHVVLAEVTYEDGGSETYTLPLKLAEGEPARRVVENVPESVLARIRTPGGEAVLYDGLADRSGASSLLAFMADGRSFPSERGGSVRGYSVGEAGMRPDRAEQPSSVRRLSAEQSNSSIILDDAFILKFFRVAESGPNPDMEIGRFLTEKTSFRHMAEVVGGIDLTSVDGAPSTLAMLQCFVPNDGDGWSFMLGEARTFIAAAGASGETGPARVVDRAAAEPPAEVAEGAARALAAARVLGRRTAEFHAALASAASSRDAAFRPRPITAAWLQTLVEDAEARIRSSLELLAGATDALADDVRPLAQTTLAAGDRLVAVVRRLAGARVDADAIRCHGDYHLGQVLRTGEDFILLDFEGEPLRPLAERRRCSAALRDVAGMLRSFSYAARTALAGTETGRGDADRERLAARARAWEAWTCAAFLGEYRAAAGRCSFLPSDDDAFVALLDVLVLEKAFYELTYELNNRPDWTALPLAGINEIAAAATPPGDSERETR